MKFEFPLEKLSHINYSYTIPLIMAASLVDRVTCRPEIALDLSRPKLLCNAETSWHTIDHIAITAYAIDFLESKANEWVPCINSFGNVHISIDKQSNCLKFISSIIAGSQQTACAHLIAIDGDENLAYFEVE